MDQVSPVEATIITEQDALKFSIYDIHTGTSIVNFQNQEPINANCLHVVNNLHFITAHANKLHIWSIYNRKCQDQKLFLPNKPSCLTISPCGSYLVVGIAENIYVWQIHSGYLMSCMSAHYQAISALKFNREGTLLFSASRDGSVMVWSAADLIAKTNNIGPLNQKNPQTNINSKGLRFIWQHHSAPVTGLEVTYGGLCISVSQDSSANIYSHDDGKRLASIVFPSPIHSIVMNKNETTCFFGGQDGNIYQLALSSLSIAQNLHSRDTSTQTPIFIGHKEAVTILQLSFDGTKLISGSNDNTCKFWDIPRKKLIREISLKSSPLNLVTILVPEGLSLTTMTAAEAPLFQVKALTRNVYNHPSEITVSTDSFLEDCSTTILRKRNITSKWESSLSQINYTIIPTKTSSLTNGDEPSADKAHVLVEKLRQKVDKLYKIKVEELLNGVTKD